MRWTPEAENAIKKVPFFVRKKVRSRVETEADKAGKQVITLAEVNATQKRYLTGMASEIKGYQLDGCFGPSGCPNAIGSGRNLLDQLELLLKEADLLGFLKSKGIRELKFHHEFRVTVAECPNACSQPQIKDVGIIAACRPGLSDAQCTQCEACVNACKENAIALAEPNPLPAIDTKRCIACGQCIPVCPTGTLEASATGYRVQLGGKLGRHPQLARELPGLYDEKTVFRIVQASLEWVKAKSTCGERLGELLQDEDFHQLSKRFSSQVL